MKCEKIRSLILTDYADKEAQTSVKTAVESHIDKCAGCREFYGAVVSGVSAPFRNAQTFDVPAVIWQNVRAAIEQQGFGSAWPVFDFRWFRTAYVISALAFTLLIGGYIGSSVTAQRESLKNKESSSAT